MTLTEAIKGLRIELAVLLGSGNLHHAIQSGNRRVHSIQLGIEALERLEGMRKQLDSNYFEFCILLPSETEEKK